MYRIKTGTFSDVEEIWTIIEKTLESKSDDAAEGRKQRDLFYLTHSIKKIELEIMNNYQHYILLFKGDIAEAFASFSILGKHPSYLKIQKMFPFSKDEEVPEALIGYMQELGRKRGADRIIIQIIGEEQRNFFAAIGFEENTYEWNSSININGIEMIKRIKAY